MNKIATFQLDATGQKVKYVSVYFDDDTDVTNFDLQLQYSQSKIKMGDSLLLEIGENVMFVKEIVKKVLNGPFKLFKQIKFNLIAQKQEFIFKYMSESFYQISIISEIGEELFQLIEESLILQQNDIKQIEFQYQFQIDEQYNELLFNTIETHLKQLIHASLVFDLMNIDQNWRSQITKSFSSFHNVQNISNCWKIHLKQEDILSILMACKSNKNLLIQSQNLLFSIKEPQTGQYSYFNQSNETQKDSKEQQYLFSNKHLFLDVSFYKNMFNLETDVMEMKEFWKWLTEKVSQFILINMKFQSSTQINRIILPILDAIYDKNQTLCLDSQELKLEYDLQTRNLLVHFKDSSKQEKEFKLEDWSFIQSFLNQFRLKTQKFHAILENISFRHNNRQIYSQIIDFQKINHKICHFTIVAPLAILQSDIRLKKLWKEHLISVQILTKRVINQKQGTQTQQSPSIQPLQVVDNQVTTAIKRYRRNQFDSILQYLQIDDQAYHLEHMTKQFKQQQNYLATKQQQQQQNNLVNKPQNLMIKKQQSYKIDVGNNYLAKDARMKILKEQQQIVQQNINKQKSEYIQQKQTKIFFYYEQNSKQKNITLKLDMREKNPEFINDLITINDLTIVQDLQISFQSEIHDGQIDKILKFFSNSKYLKYLKLKLMSNNINELVPKLIRFIKSNMKELIQVDITIDGQFQGNLEKDYIKNILNLLPFKENSKKLKTGIFKYIGLNNLQNIQNMMSIYKHIESEQILEIKTSTFDLSKDVNNNFNLRIDCNDCNISNIFDYLKILENTYAESKFTSVDIIVYQIQFESVFQFLKLYIQKIKILKVQFLNINFDQNKQDTYDKLKTVVDSYYLFDFLHLRFRDQSSTEDTFVLSYKQSISSLSVYFQGSQVNSDDFNYDRLINFSSNLYKLYEQDLKSLKLELIFDNNARYLRCKNDIFRIKGYIFKNKLNLRKFNALIKVMNQFHRTFETHRIFDEQVRAIQTKDKCISKYALIYKSIFNSQIKDSFRREMFWDSISMMIFGQLHLNLKPLLQKKFLIFENDQKETPSQSKINTADVEEFNIFSLFQQERENQNECQPTLINRQLSISQSTQENQSSLDQYNNFNQKRELNSLPPNDILMSINNNQMLNEDDIYDIEFIDKKP